MAWPPAFAQARMISEMRFDNAQRLEQVMLLRRVDKVVEQGVLIPGHSVRPRPFSGRHRAISPRFSVVRTVSVKEFMLA